MLMDILILIGITFLPFLELRASIPYGILSTDLHWSVVFLICAAANIILGPIIYITLDKFIHLFFYIPYVKKIYDHYVVKTQHKIHRGVEKYGEWAVLFFIGIPFPTTGVYSGTLAAYLIGLDYKKYIVSLIGGVLMAAVLVTIISLAGDGLFHSLFLKQI